MDSLSLQPVARKEAVKYAEACRVADLLLDNSDVALLSMGSPSATCRQARRLVAWRWH